MSNNIIVQHIPVVIVLSVLQINFCYDSIILSSLSQFRSQNNYEIFIIYGIRSSRVCMMPQIRPL